MHTIVKLLGLGLAVPENIVLQSDAARLAELIFGDRHRDFRRLLPIFDNAGIHQRYSVRPIPWFVEPHGWAERMQAYVDGASRLFVESATKAMAQARLTGPDIDCVVTVSSTGFGVPSIEARVARELGFRHCIERVPVFGLGCAGGVSGFSIASRLAAGRPGTNVLMVAMELCSLAFRLDEPTTVNVVASALFGDGAAACILATGEGGLASVESAGEHLFPDTLNLMGWTVDDPGLGIVLAQSLPHFVLSEIGKAVAGILAGNGLGLVDVDRFICHPGGAKVLDALEGALSLGQGTLNDEREVLANYGNMSSATVLFVLDRAVRSGLSDRSAMLAMGPGFSASCVTLTRAV